MGKEIKQIEKENRMVLYPVFSGMDDHIIMSCLKGIMGDAWADDETNPSCAQVIIGDLAFFAGEVKSPLARGLVLNIPSWFKSRIIYMVAENQEWGALIEKFHKGRFDKFQRYAVRKGEVGFDVERLRRFVAVLPTGYGIKRIDAEIYGKVMRNEWSRDLCSQFESLEDFMKRGTGFCVLYGGEPVCGASSYIVYDDGIEIEIDTREDHRRKGLAAACASALILECLEKGLEPRWDAANLESVGLAEKLGYKLKAPYDTWAVRRKGL